MTAGTTSLATPDRATWWLALAALPFALFALGARTGRGLLVMAAAAGLLLAAVVQLAKAGRGTNWLGGDGSTYPLLLGFGLLALGLGRRARTSVPHAPDTASRRTDPKEVP